MITYILRVVVCMFCLESLGRPRLTVAVLVRFLPAIPFVASVKKKVSATPTRRQFSIFFCASATTLRVD